MKIARVVIVAFAGLALAACGSSSNITQGSSSPSAEPTTASASPSLSGDPVVEETPTPEPTEEGYTESAFGTTKAFTQGDTKAFTVRVAAPTRPKCGYSYIGCDKPKTGDRVVTSKVVIQNTSKEAIETGYDLFVLEFADGTRMEPGDGAASDYEPDNRMDYSQKIRPGGTYTSTLTFEAPKGAFRIIMLSSSYDGEDLHGWR